ncbi:hypothetical protein WMY93_021307 [Mugilogobius chulae]|uniref:Uncharacterized protein n=1 Tax=Mugilogobius chulae TaxID=88201 RepID=A0AAW0NKT4_9GOBI
MREPRGQERDGGAQSNRLQRNCVRAHPTPSTHQESQSSLAQLRPISRGKFSDSGPSLHSGAPGANLIPHLCSCHKEFSR